MVARAVVALVVGLLALGGGTAYADAPTQVNSQVTDEAGVLDGDTAPVQAALDRLHDRTGIGLHVVFVDDFPDWGDEYTQNTRYRSNLGRRDALLAVSVKSRTSFISVDPYAFPLADGVVLGLMHREVVPRIRAGEWAAAVTALADGLRAPWDGTGAATIDRADRGAALVLLLTGAALTAYVAGLLRRRRRPAVSDRLLRAGPMAIVFLAVFAASRLVHAPGRYDLTPGRTALHLVVAATVCWSAVDGYRLRFGTVARIWACVGLVVAALETLYPVAETAVAARLLELGGLDPALFRGHSEQLLRTVAGFFLYVVYAACALGGAAVGCAAAYVRREWTLAHGSSPDTEDRQGQDDDAPAG